MNDPEVIRYLESGGDYTLAKLKLYLKKVEKNPILFWAIVVRSGKHIGNIKIDPINYRNRVGEYGILMGDRTEWRKGYAKEATLTIINYCFSGNENLRKITLGVVEDNITAVKLYEDIGFEIEGRYKNHAYHDSKWCNVLRMAIFNPAIVG